ncbi:hypothetical protein ACIBEF_32450, partial [Micromonospora sp. NPDC050795]|uniref:hypothetical protein n=1 Tax=Micromonospora sp. NPDC050795 TaxID=3364282 RepID=UPI0037B195E0
VDCCHTGSLARCAHQTKAFRDLHRHDENASVEMLAHGVLTHPSSGQQPADDRPPAYSKELRDRLKVVKEAGQRRAVAMSSSRPAAAARHKGVTDRLAPIASIAPTAAPPMNR